MATTGTYTFNPAASALTLQAFLRIGIKQPEVTMQHLNAAGVEFNLLQVELSNHQPNLWRTETNSIPLVASTATYNLLTRMVAVQDVYMRTTVNGSSTDTVLGPMSYFEYDTQSDKTLTGRPTSYLIERTLTPTITFWPVPDDGATYTVFVRLLSQPQDASLRSGLTLDLPYIYLDAAVAGLSHRLSRIYARELELQRKADYVDALTAAQNTDTQDSVNIYVQPIFDGYYR